MFEIFSMREPLYFSVWLAIYFFFYFATSRSLLGKKHWPTTLTCFFIQTAYYIMKIFSNALLVLICFLVAAVLISVVTIWKKHQKPFKYISTVIILILSAVIVGIIADVSLLFLVVDRYNLSFEGLQPHQNYTIIYYCTITIITIFTLLISSIIKIVSSKRKNTLDISKKYIFFLWIPITHLISFVMFYMLMFETALNGDPINYVITAFMTLFLIFDFVIFFISEKFEKAEKENKLYEQEIFKNKLDYQQIILLNQNKKELRKIKHDMLNILSTAKGFIEIEKYEKAINILNDATNDLHSLKGIKVCTNDTVNTILSVKLSHAEKESVKLKVNVDEKSPLLVDDYSVSRILGNLIDNAINAANNTENKTVKIDVTIDEENIMIITENEFDVKRKDELPQKGRGNGKNIIREITKKFNGSFETEICGNVYKTETELSNIKTENSETVDIY